MFIGTLEVNYEECIQTINKDYEELWTENVQLNRRNGTFKLDKGAECNIMSEKTISSLDIKGKLSEWNKWVLPQDKQNRQNG
jgi:hypothetical protein